MMMKLVTLVWKVLQHMQANRFNSNLRLITSALTAKEYFQK